MAIDLRQELDTLTAIFAAEHIDYALCGALAVAVHGYPRATQDIAMLVREEDLPRIRAAIRPAGYTVETGMIPFGIGKPTESRIFRVTKIEGADTLTLDLLLVTSALAEIWKDRRIFEIRGGRLTVVSREGILAMKRASGRPIDLADIERLEGLPDT